MPRKRGFFTCQICGTQAKRIGKQKRKFMAKFPLDKYRCREWVKNVGKEDLVYVPIEKLHALKYVCGDHFESKAFNKKKTRLKKTAVPLINLTVDPLPDEILREFPCHTASNIQVTDEPISSEHIMEEQLFPHELSGSTRTQSRKKRKSSSSEEYRIIEPSTSAQQHLFEHNYFMSTQPSTSTHQLEDFKKGFPEMKKKCSSDLENTPRKKKLMKRLRLCQRKIKLLRQGNIMPRIKSLALKTLIRAYIRNHSKKPHGKRWTSLDKALAIAIYKKSPRTYRHLQHLMSLPSIRTLQALLQGIELEPGISKTIVGHLNKKAAQLNEKDKLCALLFDEIALKKRLIFNPRTDKVEGFVDLGDDQYRSSEIANHALVFMLQGLHQKFKQPIAYYFTKGTISSQSLAVLIKNVLNTITEIGYTVLTTVCDQGPTNIGGLNILKVWSGIPLESNYFLVNDMKIFIMFDVPHLFKSIRNNFHSGGEIVIDGKRGKWSHLRDVVEKNKSTLHFKKLTALHVNPTYRSKMKVKLAAQVLSNTVAAILKLMAEKHGDEEKAQDILQTAQIVEDLDRLFDCTNGPASPKDVIKHRRQNVSKKTNHVDLWQQYKKKMSTMYFLKTDSYLRLKNVRCVQGYITTLTSLENIWKYVESKGFKYLNLRQLNQDCLENLFGMIRQHCPTNRNPTCHHFTAALKSNILTKLSTPVGRGANCEKDENEAIIDFSDFIKPSKIVCVEQQSSAKSFQVSGPEDAEPPVLHLKENEDVVLELSDDWQLADLYFPEDDAEYLQRRKNQLLKLIKKPNSKVLQNKLVFIVTYYLHMDRYLHYVNSNTFKKNFTIWTQPFRPMDFSPKKYGELFTKGNPHLTNQDGEKPTPLGKAFLPYIHGITDRIGSLLEKHNIKPIFKPTTQLRDLHRSVKDPRDPLSSAGVYRIPCSCGSV